MRYRLLLLDIDGTLRPHGAPCVPAVNVAAVTAVQRLGVRAAIATGRARASVPDSILGGLAPDYWLCAAGAQVLDAAGHALADMRLTAEQVDRLTAFCARRGCPLRYSFSDGSYAYVGYAFFEAREREMDHGIALRDGSRRDRHRGELPFSAYAVLPRAAAADFAAQWPQAGLRFVFEGETACDILPAGVDKAGGLRVLLAACGLPAAASVAVGDSDNDAGLLRAAGLGLCVAGGSAAAQAAADALCPPAAENGVAAVCRRLWPQAFPEVANEDE